MRIVRAIAVITALSTGAVTSSPALDMQASPGSQQTSLREIAITFDDLPLGGRRVGLDRLRQMTAKLVAEITAAGAPATGFVNERKLYDVAGQVDEQV